MAMFLASMPVWADVLLCSSMNGVLVDARFPADPVFLELILAASLTMLHRDIGMLAFPLCGDRRRRPFRPAVMFTIDQRMEVLAYHPPDHWPGVSPLRAGNHLAMRLLSLVERR